MKVLNLVNKEISDVKFEVSKFPDGQQQVKLIGPFMFFIPGDPIQIKARLNNFLDLELIVCAVASLRGIGVKEIHLYVPYFEGSRSDRKFEEGSNNYLKDVICPIVNSLKLDSVTVLDPHSDCLEMGLNNFKKQSNLDLVKWWLGLPPNGCVDLAKITLISPDAGASKKIYKIAEQIGAKSIITCSKDRDTLGKISSTYIPLNDSHVDKDFVIIDDICDGGATFINIAKAIRGIEALINSKIYFIVTHGIFSKGLDELSKYFDGIYCTNSYKNIDFKLIFGEEVESGLIKQLNVF